MSNTLLNDLYKIGSAWEKFKTGDKAKAADAAADCFSFETADEKARFATFCAGYMFGAPDQTEPTTDNGKLIKGIIEELPKASHQTLDFVFAFLIADERAR